MKSIIVLISLLASFAFAAPQFGDHHGHTEIIGLSRGIEVHHEAHKKEGGGGGGGGGHHEEHKQGSGGFSGSDFHTPVDVHHEHEVHLKAHPEYHYSYHVADHKHKDYHSKHEHRDGYKVKGSYSLLEPDHKTIRVVEYESDKKTGFIAKVSHKKHE